MKKSPFKKVLILGAIAVFFLGSTQTAHAYRLWSTGCEIQGEAGDGNMINQLEWAVSGSSASATQISTSIKRSGLASCAVILNSTGWASLGKSLFSSAPGINTNQAIRFYLYIDELPAAETDIANFVYNSDTSILSLHLTPTGTLKLYDTDGTTVLDTYTTPLQTGTWLYFQWGYGAHQTQSLRWTKVYLDEVEILNAEAFAAGPLTGFQLGIGVDSTDTTARLYFDDVALGYQKGAEPVEAMWPGPGRIVHLNPNGPGTYNDCSSGDWTSVDEVIPDDDATFCILASLNNQFSTTVESPYAAGLVDSDVIKLLSVGDRGKKLGNSGTIFSQFFLIPPPGAGCSTMEESPLLNSQHVATYKTNVGGNANSPGNYVMRSEQLCGDEGAYVVAPGSPNSIGSQQIAVKNTFEYGVADIYLSTLWLQVEYNKQNEGGGGSGGGGGGGSGGGSGVFTDAVGRIPYASDASPFLNTGLMPQEKGATDTGASGLGLGADFFTALSSICLGPSNCISSWWPTLQQPSSCKFEVQRVYGASNTFGSTFSTQLCDSKLTPSAVSAGWVATGMDYCDSGSCGPGSIAGCVYTRMVCTGGVTASLPTKAGPYTHPVTSAQTGDGYNFTYTPQCNDGIDNGDGDGLVDYSNDPECKGFWDNDESA